MCELNIILRIRTGLPPPAGVRSPSAWQCRISIGVNGLCLTFSVRPCDRISSSIKIVNTLMYIYKLRKCCT